MAYRLIFDRGLYPPVSSEYESPRLKEIVERLREINLEMMKLQDEVRESNKKKKVGGFAQ